MNTRYARHISRLAQTLPAFASCASGHRPAWWTTEQESGLRGHLCGVYERVDGMRDGALLFTDEALGLLPSGEGPTDWLAYTAIERWRIADKMSSVLLLDTAHGPRSIEMRQAVDPLRVISLLLLLSRTAPLDESGSSSA
jgi:hypothetical protein